MMRRHLSGLAFVMLAASTAIAADPPAASPAPDAHAPVAAPAPAAAAPAAPAAPTVKKAEIACDGKVKNDGAVNLVFTPAGGTAMDVRVTLQKGMGKKDVCRDIAKELSVAAGEKYKVEGDGDEVNIAGKKDAKFSIALGGQTATGVTVAIKLK